MGPTVDVWHLWKSFFQWIGLSTESKICVLNSSYWRHHDKLSVLSRPGCRNRSQKLSVPSRPGYQILANPSTTHIKEPTKSEDFDKKSRRFKSIIVRAPRKSCHFGCVTLSWQWQFGSDIWNRRTEPYFGSDILNRRREPYDRTVGKNRTCRASRGDP